MDVAPLHGMNPCCGLPALAVDLQRGPCCGFRALAADFEPMQWICKPRLWTRSSPSGFPALAVDVEPLRWTSSPCRGWRALAEHARALTEDVEPSQRMASPFRGCAIPGLADAARRSPCGWRLAAPSSEFQALAMDFQPLQRMSSPCQGFQALATEVARAVLWIRSPCCAFRADCL